MPRKFPPNIILYTKRGKIYNILCGIFWVLGSLSAIVAIALDFLGKKSEYTFAIFLAMFLLVLSLIFNIKSSKHSTVIFL